MTKYLFSLSAVLAGVAAAVFAALGPSQAMAASSTPTACATPVVSQAFLGWGDSNYYTPAPGVVTDRFSGSGWVLSGGAKIISTTLADGATGQVLELPPGASATSPVMCVESGEPYARMITRVVGVNAASNATTLYVTQAGSSKLGSGMPVLGKTGWAESPPDNVDPGNATEDVSFTYKSNMTSGDLELYDLFIDPHMRD